MMDAAATHSAEAGVEEVTFTPPPPRYQWLLLGMLMSATIFEGYDVTIFHLCTPDIARTFHMTDRAVGALASTVRLGFVGAFIVVAVADRIGRKQIVSITVLLYALFTLCTALSRGLVTFTIFQTLAQVFLSAEFAVAVIMISEEFPDGSRGRGVAALNMVGLLGVVAAGSVYGLMAESHWGWRGMYLLGIAPLLLVAFLRRGLRETARFEAIRGLRAARPRRLLPPRVRIREALAPLTGPYRSRLLLVAALWNSVGIVNATTNSFFSLYAKRNHHWKSREIGHAIELAYLLGTFGPLLSGYLLDRVGRRITTCLFYLCGSLAVVILFQSESHDMMLAGMVLNVFAFQGARTATATYSVELFPTEVRATCYSMTVQVLGQVAGLIIPFTVGSLASKLGGLGNAATMVAVGPLIGAALVLMFAPETRGKRLEEVAPSRLIEIEIEVEQVEVVD